MSGIAYDIASQAQAEQVLAKQSESETTIPEAVNDATTRVGSETIGLVGQFHKVRPQGGEGVIDTPWSVHLHPESVGNGMLEKAPGHGIDNAQGSTFVTGRIARNEVDTPLVRKLTRAGLADMSWAHTAPLPVDGLALLLPIAAGVTTYLKAEAFIEVQSQDTATAIELRAIIGDDNEINGKETDRLVDAGAWGEPFVTGASSQWHPVYLSHGRLLIGTEAQELDGVPIYVRTQASAGASGSSPIGASGGTVAPPTTSRKFNIGDTYRFNSSNINVRSSPGLEYSVLDQGMTGQTGTINNGPRSVNGYVWWRINNPAFGWVAEDYISNITAPPAAPPPPTGPTNPQNPGPEAPRTNRIRGGWIRITRIPV